MEICLWHAQMMKRRMEIRLWHAQMTKWGWQPSWGKKSPLPAAIHNGLMLRGIQMASNGAILRNWIFQLIHRNCDKTLFCTTVGLLLPWPLTEERFILTYTLWKHDHLLTNCGIIFVISKLRSEIEIFFHLVKTNHAIFTEKNRRTIWVHKRYSFPDFERLLIELFGLTLRPFIPSMMAFVTAFDIDWARFWISSASLSSSSAWIALKSSLLLVSSS